MAHGIPAQAADSYAYVAGAAERAKTMKIHESHFSQCPNCSEPINALGSTHVERQPEPFDLLLCTFCGTVMVLETDYSVRVATPELLAQYPHELLQRLMVAMLAILSNN